MIKEFAENLCLVEDEKFSVGGLQIGSRMTIVRMNDGNLFVHSPIALSKTINDSIDSIGKPRFIIAPNTMHHLFLKQFYDQYSDAELYIVPGLREKRPDFSHAQGVLDEGKFPRQDKLKHRHIKGIPKLEEVV